MLGTALGARGTAVNETDKNLFPNEGKVFMGRERQYIRIIITIYEVVLSCYQEKRRKKGIKKKNEAGLG